MSPYMTCRWCNLVNHVDISIVRRTIHLKKRGESISKVYFYFNVHCYIIQYSMVNMYIAKIIVVKNVTIKRLKKVVGRNTPKHTPNRPKPAQISQNPPKTSKIRPENHQYMVRDTANHPECEHQCFSIVKLNMLRFGAWNSLFSSAKLNILRFEVWKSPIFTLRTSKC